MKRISEDYTVGALMGVPVFCVNRVYAASRPSYLHRVQYKFEFGNGYGASVVEFVNRDFSSGHQFEFAVLKDGAMCYDSSVTGDIERGDENRIDELLSMVEALKTHIIRD